jgi:hypothetical protein
MIELTQFDHVDIASRHACCKPRHLLKTADALAPCPVPLERAWQTRAWMQNAILCNDSHNVSKILVERGSLPGTEGHFQNDRIVI